MAFSEEVPIDVLRTRFIDYGVQYYVAGRCSVATALNPVAANILHHAIEMFLKAGLCAHTNERQRKELGHDLLCLLNEFKAHHDTEGRLDEFDVCVRELQQYEEIRYPEGMMRAGAVGMRMQFGPAPMLKGPTRLGGSTNIQEYSLDMKEIDALVRGICVAAKINGLNYLTTMFREPGKTYLRQENAEASLFD